MFFKRPGHRIFDYIPRFYDPQTDKDEKLKRKLGFKHNRKHRGKKRNPVIWLVLILLVIYLLLRFGGKL